MLKLDQRNHKLFKTAGLFFTVFKMTEKNTTKSKGNDFLFNIVSLR